MKTTIVMTTFNGEKYINEQLESIRLQSSQPDEVLILDDCSSDRTMEIVKDYIKTYTLANWKIIQNKKNIGWIQNFYKGFELAKGDLIFPCDQDDIWRLNKIEFMTKIMSDNPEINVLVGEAKNFHTIPDHQEKVDFKTIKFQQVPFDKSFKKISQGCRMCFRKSFFLKYKKFIFPELAHDRFLSYYGKLTKSYYSTNFIAIDYRFHYGSASNPTKKTKEYRIKSIKTDKLELDSLFRNIDFTNANIEEKVTLEKAIIWNQNRLMLVENNNYIRGLLLLRYLNYYPNKKHFITDWIYSIKENI